MKQSRAQAKSRRLRKYASIREPTPDFALYQDDGTTYAYEQGDSRITRLHWNDVKSKLDHAGRAGVDGGGL